VIDAEESAFSSTLRTGTAIFDAAVEETRRGGAQAIAGSQAFQLHDTYGFPIDLTLEMAAEQGLQVDEPEFRRLMSEQRQRAKADAAGKKTGNADISAFAQILDRSGRVVFTGYDEVAGDATVVGLLVGGVSVPSASAGTDVDVVLDRTPFYAESGGQLADTGVITAAGSQPGRSSSAPRCTPRSTSSAGAPSPGRTRPRTWCIARSAVRSATRRPRRARRTRRAGSGSTSPRSGRSRPLCSRRPRTRSTGS